MELLSVRVHVCSTLVDTASSVPKGLCQFTLPAAEYKHFSCSELCETFFNASMFHFGYSGGCVEFNHCFS